MDTNTILMIVLVIVVILLIGVSAGFAISIAKKKNKDNTTESQEQTQKILDALKAQQDIESVKLKANHDQINNELKEITDIGRRTQETLMKELETRLDKMNAQMYNNQEKNIRETAEIKQMVEEKMHTSISSNFDKAFKPVADQIDKVKQQISELNTLNDGVKKIQGIFSNVKTAGILGEIMLENILENVLPSNLIYSQYPIKAGKVDYAIRITPDNSNVVLPIDSKFPSAKYNEYSEALSSCDKNIIEQKRKNIIQEIKEEAKSISNKYINPPETTPHAIMYLPTEGIFALIVQDTELLAYLYKELNIIPAGPTTIIAILQALMSTYRTAQISGQVHKVVEEIKGFKHDLVKFLDEVVSVKKTMGKAQEGIRKIENAANRINSSLDNYELGITDNSEKQESIQNNSSNNEQLVAPKKSTSVDSNILISSDEIIF